MKIHYKQKFIVIRYGAQHVPDPIKEHYDVFNDNGVVWFGKIGTKPSEVTLQSSKYGDFYYIILYSNKMGAYLCKVSEISYSKPNESYPKYYDYLLERNLRFSIFFMITEITKLDRLFMRNFITSSSKQTATTTLRTSMSPFIIVEYIDDDMILKDTLV